MVPLRHWTAEPSAVALLYRLERCDDGAPVILDPESAGKAFSQLYRLTENGEGLNAEAVPRVTLSAGQRTYVTLLLDFSDSTNAVKADLAEGARLFAQRLLASTENLYVSVRIFDGRVAPHTVVLPTRALADLESGLTSLGTAPPDSPILGPNPDASTTDLYGAFLNGVTDAQAWQSAVMTRNEGGIVTSGYVAVFTAGRDTANRLSISQAQAAVQRARTLQDGAPVVGTFTVALEGEDYTVEARSALLEVVGGEQFLLEGKLAELNQRFTELADRIGEQARSTHLLVYCSPAREGNPKMELRVAPEFGGAAPGSGGLTYEFSAATFFGGCSDFLKTVCDGKACAGFSCGACSDATQTCVASTGQCVDECELRDQCEGETVINDLGYSRICGADGALSRCGGQCIDTSEDAENCGGCGVICGPGGACSAGACLCGSGLVACGGSCTDTSTDPANCGACGNACTAGDACVDGACLCGPGLAACGGSCTDTSNDAAHCGACGNACSVGDTCVAGGCLADLEWANWPIPAASGVGPAYSSTPDTVTDSVTGLTWQRHNPTTWNSWPDALSYCSSLSLGGHSDWRLPTLIELTSIINYGKYNPAINGTFFPGTPNSGFWTSSQLASDPSRAWSVDFSGGSSGPSAKTDQRRVRCVR